MQLQKKVLLAVSFDFLEDCNLDLDEGAVGVVEDTEAGKFYVVEVVRFADMEEAKFYAETVLLEHEEKLHFFDTVH